MAARQLPQHLSEIDGHGRSALLSSLIHGKILAAGQIVKSLSNVPKDIVQYVVCCKDLDGNSVLPMAARIGWMWAVEKLLPFASDVEIRQAQVETTRLANGRDEHELERLQLHHALLRALVDDHGWFHQPGAMGPLPRRSGRPKRQRLDNA